LEKTVIVEKGGKIVSGISPLTARCSLGGVMEGRLRGEEKKCQASSVEKD
jgi:hypothetical protein